VTVIAADGPLKALNVGSVQVTTPADAVQA
jgi:hypothetical protein